MERLESNHEVSTNRRRLFGRFIFSRPAPARDDNPRPRYPHLDAQAALRQGFDVPVSDMPTEERMCALEDLTEESLEPKRSVFPAILAVHKEVQHILLTGMPKSRVD
jgi:hypothetical protein